MLDEFDIIVLNEPNSGLKILPPKAYRHTILEKMHEMRLTTFENRINDPMNVKPYLPMLSSDEKEVIMEQYFASKKKLSNC